MAAGAMVAAALVGGVIASQYQARRAERRFQEVRQLANSFIFDVNARLQSNAGPTEARRQIVSTALKYLERLTAESSGDVALQADLTAAYEAIGDIQSQSLVDINQARRSYLKAIELGERLIAGRNQPPVIRRALAAAYMGMLDTHLGERNSQQAIESGEKAIQIAESAGTDNNWSRDFLLTAYRRVAGAYLESGRPVQALGFTRKGLRLALEHGGQASEDLRYLEALLHWQNARALKNRGDISSAIGEAARGRQLYFSLSERSDYRFLGEAIMGLTGPVAGDGAGPLELYTRIGTPAERMQAHDIARQAAAQDPGNRIVGVRASTYFAIAHDQLTQNPDAAYQSYREAIRIAGERLATEGRGGSRGVLSNAEALFGEALVEKGNLAEGLTYLKRALEVAAPMPTLLITDRRRLIDALLRLGRAEVQARQLEPARVHLERCLALSLTFWPDAQGRLALVRLYRHEL